MVIVGRFQDACSKEWRDNLAGQDNMRNSAAANFTQAADLAFRLHHYAMISDLVERANRLYRSMLTYRYRTVPGDKYVRANITANLDLLRRIPKPHRR